LALAAAAPTIALLAAEPAAKPSPDKPAGEEGVTATEDLMREHGALRRLLLIFEEGVRRVRAKDDLSPEVFHRCAVLVRNFVENYHERLEENFLFPEFEKRQKMTTLTAVLRKQHLAGRALTDVILGNSVGQRFRSQDSQRELIAACQSFIRMYRPHASREDTELFPALREMLSAKQVEAMGDAFEKEEGRLFGDKGFENIVQQVIEVEKHLGMYDLDQYTPAVALRK
jgi:hemerythrin-like domain-containing protein